MTYRRRSAFWSLLGAFYAARAVPGAPGALGAYSAPPCGAQGHLSLAQVARCTFRCTFTGLGTSTRRA